ncbi:MAG: carbonic anhydrase [Pseudomonadales bacterium]|nr:carbonic anhydrase [Pseudomonadales bacterium]
MIDADQALARLKQGNRDFVEQNQVRIEMDAQRRSELADTQSPFAIILGCSDSRAPAELVFQQGLGDLFVIRVAGNIVAPSQIGSIEFAAEQFGTRLVVVMGHSRCGAVGASIKQLQQPSEQRSPNLHSIVSRISPHIEPLLDGSAYDPEALYKAAVRANIDASVRQLQHGSEILEQLIENDGLKIVGAEYDLDSGIVEFFDD